MAKKRKQELGPSASQPQKKQQQVLRQMQKMEEENRIPEAVQEEAEEAVDEVEEEEEEAVDGQSGEEEEVEEEEEEEVDEEEEGGEDQSLANQVSSSSAADAKQYGFDEDDEPVEKLLEPFRKEQLLIILKEAADVVADAQHPKWNAEIQGSTFSSPKESQNVESGGSSKRTQTTEEEESPIPDDSPLSQGSTMSRPIGREAAKKQRASKGKEKVTTSEDSFTQGLERLEIVCNRAESYAKKMLTVVELQEEGKDRRAEKKDQRAEKKAKAKKYYVDVLMLKSLVDRGINLSPAEEKMKHKLISQLYR